MKRILGILICLALLMSLPAATRAQGAALTGGDYEYRLAENWTAILTRFLGTAAEPEIPAVLDGHPVTQVGENAFRDCSFLVKARVPDSIEILGTQAFYNCAALEKVELPLSLAEIGDLAFAYCTSLRGVIIPEGVQRIGEFAFGDCSKLSTAAVPASVTWIGPDAFLGIDPGPLSGIYGHEGSYAQEYAQANNVPFFPFQEGIASATAAPEAATVPEEVSGDLPPPAADDLPPEPTPGPTVTAEITVRFPHAERTGTYTGEMKDGLPHGKGAFTSANADGVGWTYDGAWENGVMNGYGTVTWPTEGLEIRGQYRDNQPYQGEWFVKGASVYTGGFRMCPDCGVSTFHGTGKLTNRLGRIIYEGPFADGLLSETAQARQARAQALDPNCGTLSSEGYSALMNTPGGGTGTLLRLDGRVREVLTDEEHGLGEFILLNKGDAACPVQVSYRYGTGEERAQAGRSATVWGTVTGLDRVKDRRGRDQMVIMMDADVIRLNTDQAQRGLNEVVITAVKALDGRALKNREFTFALDETFTVIEERVNPLDGTVTFVPVTYTARQQTQTNGRDGTVAFDPVRYTADDIGGVFTYTVTEVPGLEEGMAYDPMVMTVTVIVTDNGNGRPAATVFYPDDVVFNNSVAPLAIPQAFEATVDLRGRPLEEAEFTFQLLEGGEILQVTSNSGDGRIVFDDVEFTAADIGTTRRFMIRQVPTNLPGVTYDPMEITYDVAVEFDPGGIGAPMLTIPTPEDTTFNNVFAAQGEIRISFDVSLEGRAIKNGEFSFALSRGGTVLQTKRNGRDGKVSFDPVTATEADAGRTFSCTVQQVPGNEPGMSYDTAVKTAEAAVSLEGGLLKAGVTYPTGTGFVNRFTQQVTAPVLSAVDVDKTAVTTGDAVTFTPRVSGGVKPYSYHYVLYRDGAVVKDIGWLEDAARRSQLGTAGSVRMQVQVQDAEGRLSQAVMSPEVTVNKPAWSPKDLSGTWKYTMIFLSRTSSTSKTVLNSTYNMTLTVDMKDDRTGTTQFDNAGYHSGTLEYAEGKVRFVHQYEDWTGAWEGSLELKNGVPTLTGTFYEEESMEDGPDNYTGTWTAVKEN